MIPPFSLFHGNCYTTTPRKVSWPYKLCPELLFYPRLVALLIRGSRLSKKNSYTGVLWAAQSERIVRYLEALGCRFRVEGMEHFHKLSTPCVFAGNHMSTLETMCLPAMIQPAKNTTFVIKESLLKYPFFRDLLSARCPIPLARVNPREDFKKIMNDGTELLQNGVSVIIFPQSGRRQVFTPSEFNSGAVKLARNAGVPVVPLALDTRAWAEGKLISDFGRLHAEREIHFRFGEPITVQGNGKAEQAALVDFIAGSLREWNVPVAD